MSHLSGVSRLGFGDLAGFGRQAIVIVMDVRRTMEIAIQKHQRGELCEAEAIYRRVLASEPDNADALHLLGVIAFQTGRLDLAIGSIRRAIEVRPAMAEAHNSLGNALRARGLLQEAIAAYRGAVRLRGNYAEAHYNLGMALRESGCVEEAIESLRRAIQLQPGFVEAANDLGSALREAGRIEEAAVVLRQAVGKAPGFFKAHNNLGNALKALGRFDEAEAAVRAALEIRGDIAEIHINLGNVLREKGELAGAIAATREAIRLRPDLADAHQNLGSVLLLAGDYTEGWREYEWRWRCQNMGLSRAALRGPQWDGSNLDGRTILLHSDAGLGDAIQCARYIPLVADRGGKVVVECQRELHRLLGNLGGVSQLISAEEPLPPFDVHCPLMSLPLAFETTVETIPRKVPYLTPEESLVRRWAERLADDGRPRRVGLAWAGNPGHTHDRKRSVSLAMLAPLAGAGDIAFHSLQVGEAARQAAAAAPGGLKVIDHFGELTDFAETAALITNLDLVITVDTSVAHLAGALGKAVWMMLPFAPDWRWMLGRAESPWYPTMKLFRQERFGDWVGVIERVMDSLVGFAGMDRK